MAGSIDSAIWPTAVVSANAPRDCPTGPRAPLDDETPSIRMRSLRCPTWMTAASRQLNLGNRTLKPARCSLMPADDGCPDGSQRYGLPGAERSRSTGYSCQGGDYGKGGPAEVFDLGRSGCCTRQVAVDRQCPRRWARWGVFHPAVAARSVGAAAWCRLPWLRLSDRCAREPVPAGTGSRAARTQARSSPC